MHQDSIQSRFPLLLHAWMDTHAEFLENLGYGFRWFRLWTCSAVILFVCRSIIAFRCWFSEYVTRQTVRNWNFVNTLWLGTFDFFFRVGVVGVIFSCIIYEILLDMYWSFFSGTCFWYCGIQTIASGALRHWLGRQLLKLNEAIKTGPCTRARGIYKPSETCWHISAIR